MDGKMDDERLRMLRAATPAQKLSGMQRIFDWARQIKESSWRKQHPDWTEEQIQRAVRDFILFGRS